MFQIIYMSFFWVSRLFRSQGRLVLDTVGTVQGWRQGLLVLGLGGLLLACENNQRLQFQGYVEGEYIYLASSRAGRLEALHATRGINVVKGSLLVELESLPELHALRQAKQQYLAATAELEDMRLGRRPEEVAMAAAQLEQAKADALNARIKLQRHEVLIKTGGVSKRELDDSIALAHTTAAKVAELASQLEVYRLPAREKAIVAQQATTQAAYEHMAQLDWELEQKKLYAPEAGLVVDTLFRVGEWVAAGRPVVQLLPPQNVKIRFFVPEILLSRLKLGQAVVVQADGLASLPATISYLAINAEYTPPIIYSNETRSKLVFMVEALPAASALHPGQPVSVSLP